MLDIRFIREKTELIKKCSKEKGYDIDIDDLLQKNEIRNKKLRDRENLKKELNDISDSSGGQPPTPEAIQKAKKIKEKLAIARKEFRKADDIDLTLRREVPNIFPDDTPLGGEEANREERKWGDTKDKGFKVINHLSWGEQRGLIDFERGAKVAGHKFYYLKGSLVDLELAITQLGMELAKKHGFTATMMPHLVNTRVLEGAGFSAKGEERQIYKIEDEDLNLIATAEIPLTGLHADEILNEAGLPTLYAGLSPAYRVEGGAYGKYNRGLFRTHQFNKLELYVFCQPEKSETMHQQMVALEEEFCKLLEIPYRVVRIAARELGAPAFKKYDVEYWSPVDKIYRELMSCSNVTDYQARRLNIRYRDKKGEIQYAYTLNGTLAAMSRIPIAIIENHQDKEGKVAIPKALQPYMQGQKTI